MFSFAASNFLQYVHVGYCKFWWSCFLCLIQPTWEWWCSSKGSSSSYKVFIFQDGHPIRTPWLWICQVAWCPNTTGCALISNYFHHLRPQVQSYSAGLLLFLFFLIYLNFSFTFLFIIFLLEQARVIHNCSSEWLQIKEAAEKARATATSEGDEIGEMTCSELLEALELSRCLFLMRWISFSNVTAYWTKRNKDHSTVFVLFCLNLVLLDG